MAKVVGPLLGSRASGSIARALTFRDTAAGAVVQQSIGRPAVGITFNTDPIRLTLAGLSYVWRVQMRGQLGGFTDYVEGVNYTFREMLASAQVGERTESRPTNPAPELAPPDAFPQWRAGAIPSPRDYSRRFIELFAVLSVNPAYGQYLDNISEADEIISRVFDLRPPLGLRWDEIQFLISFPFTWVNTCPNWIISHGVTYELTTELFNFLVGYVGPLTFNPNATKRQIASQRRMQEKRGRQMSDRGKRLLERVQRKMES